MQTVYNGQKMYSEVVKAVGDKDDKWKMKCRE